MPCPPAPLRLQQALFVLQQGGVIACPTEAVWGLSCDPWDREAVARLLQMKRRPQSKGLILVAASAAQLEFLFEELGADQRNILTESWPGPSTWLVPHGSRVPDWICGEHDKVAVRVSAHPVVSALCSAWGGPLVSTSANFAGARPAMEAFQVRRYFRSELDYVLPGRTGAAGKPTTIRDLASGQVIRD